MTDHEIAEALQGLTATCDEPFTAYIEAPAEDDLHAIDTVSFAEAGVLTNNAGFVLRMSDGTEYQITVVKSH